MSCQHNNFITGASDGLVNYGVSVDNSKMDVEEPEDGLYETI